MASRAHAPPPLPLVLLGAGLLWFGWFDLTPVRLSPLANSLRRSLNTVATATAALSWILVEKIRDGKPTTLGVASGAVAGAVATRPRGFVTPMGALGRRLRRDLFVSSGAWHKFGYDDSL